PNPKAGGVTLAGTLTVPEGSGAYPVFILINGSGAQDRDETIMGHKSFAVLADYLARRKIASLRVDDRGIGKSTGNFATATTDDFAEDVRAGVAFLRERPEVDAKRIGLIGHSEGGIIAPMVAASDPDVAFVVLLAGTGVPGDAVMQEQQKAIIGAMGLGADVVAANRKVSEAGMTAIKNARDGADARKKIDAVIAEQTASLPQVAREKATKQLQAAFYPWCSAWFIRFASLDPREYLSQVGCPVLALNGSLDTQVIASQNLPAIEAALKGGGNRFVSVRELPKLNHLFQTARTGSPTEYAAITQTIAPEVLQTIGDWIVTQAKP
ncbi:MAG: alpha/beta fold hydrolase, partial [Armatimonadetes bacterium]|nr:alpha/beta fold hydrolase [Armatimonadota bacterium]